MAKRKCDCGKMAVYCYMPGYSGGGNIYHCDDCISTVDDEGCSCNYHHTNEPISYLDCVPEQPRGVEGKDWRWVKEDAGIWIDLDDRGRPYVCVEYDYDKNGYNIPTWWSNFKMNIWFKKYTITQVIKRWWKRKTCSECQNKPTDESPT